MRRDAVRRSAPAFGCWQPRCAAFLVVGWLGARYVDNFLGTAASRRRAIRPSSAARDGRDACSFASPSLGGRSAGGIRLSAAGLREHPHRRYPVLYLLHGIPGAAARVHRDRADGRRRRRADARRHRAQPRSSSCRSAPPGRSRTRSGRTAIGPAQGWETFVCARPRAGGRRALPDDPYARRAARSPGLSEGGYGAINIGAAPPARVLGRRELVRLRAGRRRALDLRRTRALLATNSPLRLLPRVAPRAAARRHVLLVLLGQRRPAAPSERAPSRASSGATASPHRYFVAGRPQLGALARTTPRDAYRRRGREARAWLGAPLASPRRSCSCARRCCVAATGWLYLPAAARRVSRPADRGRARRSTSSRSTRRCRCSCSSPSGSRPRFCSGCSRAGHGSSG